jgi:secreted Zn-dependent insulinase-like peptidase
MGIDAPASIKSIENIAMTRLFVELYTNCVIEENYDAELAGIHYHLYAHQGGLTVQLSGISENQPKLLEKLLFRLCHHQANEENFVLFKKQLIKHWQNSDKSKSISQLFSTLSSLMQPNNPCADELATKLNEITFSQYEDFCKVLFEKITIDVLIYGNWLIEHANKIVTNIKQSFTNNYNNKHTVQCPVVDITNQKTLILPKQIPDHDHATVLYTPLATRDESLVALAMVTSHILSPLFFQKMRTEKQYGYLVGVSYVPINRFPGIAFYIQSPNTDSITLTKAIDEFITNSIEMLTDISSENWLQLINGLAGQLKEKDNNLRIKSQRFWAAICNKDTSFSHKDKLITAILSLKFEHVINFIKSHLMIKKIPDRIILSSLKMINSTVIKKIEHELSGKIINKENNFTKNIKRKY